MNIAAIQNGIGETATKVFESIKGTAIWTGHQISKGFNKFVELMKSAWNTAFPFIKEIALKTVAFLRTAPGLGIVIGTASLILACTSHSMRDKKWVSLALQVSSIALAIGAGAVVGYGYATGMHTPLI